MKNNFERLCKKFIKIDNFTADDTSVSFIIKDKDLSRRKAKYIQQFCDTYNCIYSIKMIELVNENEEDAVRVFITI